MQFLKKCFIIARIPSAAVIALLLSSCASLDPQTSGQIVGSIGMQMTISDAHFQGAYLRFRSADGKEHGSISYSPDLLGGVLAEIKDGEFRGATFQKTLPAGEYDFVWEGPENRMNGEINLIAAFTAKEMPISHFRVLPGQVTYVGCWEATPVNRKRLFFGPEKMIGYTFSKHDRQARDLAAIQRKNQKNGTSALATAPVTGTSSTPVRKESGTDYLAPVQ